MARDSVVGQSWPIVSVFWGVPVHVGCPRACWVPPSVHDTRQSTTRVSPPQASAHHTRQHTTRVSPPIVSAHQMRQSTTRVSQPHPSAHHPRQSTLESSVTVRPASELWRAAAPAGGSAVRCSGFPCAARAERAAQVHVIPPPSAERPGRNPSAATRQNFDLNFWLRRAGVGSEARGAGWQGAVKKCEREAVSEQGLRVCL